MFLQTLDPDNDPVIDVLMARILCSPNPNTLNEISAEAIQFTWNRLGRNSPPPDFADYYVCINKSSKLKIFFCL